MTVNSINRRKVLILATTAAVLFLIGGLIILIVNLLYDFQLTGRDAIVTNVTDTAATVTWVSDTPYIGRIYFAEDAGKITKILPRLAATSATDDRADGRARYTHHVTIRDLKPDTDYYFAIGGELISHQLKISELKTKALREQIATPDPIYGKIENADANDAVIVIADRALAQQEFISATLSENATYTMDLNSFVNSSPASATSLSASVRNRQKVAMQFDFTSSGLKPLETIVLRNVDDEIGKTGENENFTKLVPRVSAQETITTWGYDVDGTGPEAREVPNISIQQLFISVWGQKWAAHRWAYEASLVCNNAGHTGCVPVSWPPAGYSAPTVAAFTPESVAGGTTSTAADGVSPQPASVAAAVSQEPAPVVIQPAPNAINSSICSIYQGKPTNFNRIAIFGDSISENSEALSAREFVNGTLQLDKITRNGVSIRTTYEPGDYQNQINQYLSQPDNQRAALAVYAFGTNDCYANADSAGWANEVVGFINKLIDKGMYVLIREVPPSDMPHCQGSVNSEQINAKLREVANRADLRYLPRILSFNQAEKDQLRRDLSADRVHLATYTNYNEYLISKIVEARNQTVASCSANLSADQYVPVSSAQSLRGTESLANLALKASAQDGATSLTSQSEISSDGYQVKDNGVYAFSQSGGKVAETEVIVSGDSVNLRLFEDANANGVLDAGESPVQDLSSYSLNKVASTFTYKLNAGWNLIHVPMVISNGNTSAAKLTSLWKQQGAEILHVARFANGQFEVYTNRGEQVTFSKDFPLFPGMGIFVFVQKPVTVLSLSGNEPNTSAPLRLNNGWNLIGLASPNQSYTAASLLSELKKQSFDSSTLSQFESGTYQSLVRSEGTDYGNDFALNKTRGYFVRVETLPSGSQQFTP